MRARLLRRLQGSTGAETNSAGAQPSEMALLTGQREAIERPLWVAVRLFEKRACTLGSLADEQEENGSEARTAVGGGGPLRILRGAPPFGAR